MGADVKNHFSCLATTQPTFYVKLKIRFCFSSLPGSLTL